MIRDVLLIAVAHADEVQHHVMGRVRVDRVDRHASFGFVDRPCRHQASKSIEVHDRLISRPPLE